MSMNLNSYTWAMEQQCPLGTRRVRNGVPEVYCKHVEAAPVHDHPATGQGRPQDKAAQGKGRG